MTPTDFNSNVNQNGSGSMGNMTAGKHRRSGQVKFGLIVAGLVIGLVALLGSIFTVNERELAVVLQFGQPVNSITEPGLNFKIPFVQEVRRLPRTKQFRRSSASETLVDLPSKDGKKIEVSAWAIWKITDPDAFVRVLRTVENGERAVKVRVRAVIRDVITSYDLAEAVRSTDRELTYSFRFEENDAVAEPQDGAPVKTLGDDVVAIRIGREKIMNEIRSRVQERLAVAEEGESGDGDTDRGIELVDVGISDISFVPSVRQASFDRLNAFMESIAAGYENVGQQRKQEIINATNAEVEKILGEGEEQSKLLRGQVDAEIIGEYARAIEKTGEFYNFIKTLEVYEMSLNGKTKMILTTDSPIFRLLKEMDMGAQPSGQAADRQPTREAR